jgi:hypothetical protein
VLDSVAYSKNYFYNRNRIKTANGPIWLTVPVITKGRFGQRFVDTRIDNTQDWRDKHWKSITYAYGRSPFFEKYSEYFKTTFSRDWEFLTDICVDTFAFLLKSFGIETKMVRSSELNVGGSREDLLMNVCKRTAATHYLSGPDGRNYLNLDRWREGGIEVSFQNYVHPTYPQMYGESIPNLSAIDLLFNLGEGAREVLVSTQPEYFGGAR